MSTTTFGTVSFTGNNNFSHTSSEEKPEPNASAVRSHLDPEDSFSQEISNIFDGLVLSTERNCPSREGSSSDIFKYGSPQAGAAYPPVEKDLSLTVSLGDPTSHAERKIVPAATRLLAPDIERPTSSIRGGENYLKRKCPFSN